MTMDRMDISTSTVESSADGAPEKAHRRSVAGRNRQHCNDESSPGDPQCDDPSVRPRAHRR